MHFLRGHSDHGGQRAGRLLRLRRAGIRSRPLRGEPRRGADHRRAERRLPHGPWSRRLERTATTTIKASTSKSSSVPALATHETVPYNTADTTEAPSTPPGELTEWKVIGIAVITITFIATVVLLVSFFDSWWGFVRAAVCGKSRKGDMSTRGLAGETLVPDWEKRSWEFRLASEDGHRYPTMSSLGSVVQEKEGVLDEPGWGEHDIKSPEMAYGGI